MPGPFRLYKSAIYSLYDSLNRVQRKELKSGLGSDYLLPVCREEEVLLIDKLRKLRTNNLIIRERVSDTIMAIVRRSSLCAICQGHTTLSDPEQLHDHVGIQDGYYREQYHGQNHS